MRCLRETPQPVLAGLEPHVRGVRLAPQPAAPERPDSLANNIIAALGELAGGNPGDLVAEIHRTATERILPAGGSSSTAATTTPASATTVEATTKTVADPRMEPACVELVFNEARGWFEPCSASSSTAPTQRAQSRPIVDQPTTAQLSVPRTPPRGTRPIKATIPFKLIPVALSDEEKLYWSRSGERRARRLHKSSRKRVLELVFNEARGSCESAVVSSDPASPKRRRRRDE